MILILEIIGLLDFSEHLMRLEVGHEILEAAAIIVNAQIVTRHYDTEPRVGRSGMNKVTIRPAGWAFCFTGPRSGEGEQRHAKKRAEPDGDLHGNDTRSNEPLLRENPAITRCPFSVLPCVPSSRRTRRRRRR